MACGEWEAWHYWRLMPSLEAVCARLFGRPGWIPKVIIGGALSFVPVLNLFALGYLLVYGRRLRRSQQLDLPEWSEMNWPRLFIDGVRMLSLLSFFTGIPLVLGWILSLLLFFITFGILGVVAYFPLAICGFLSPILFLCSLGAYLKEENFRDAFQVRTIAEEGLRIWKPLALPVVCFWGIFLMALPLYGLSFFIGAWVLIAFYGTLRSRNSLHL